MDFKKIVSLSQKYTSPQAIKDLDVFLDEMPSNVGNNALLAAGAACLMGAMAVWFTSMETEKVSKLHSELMTVQALQPPVPTLKNVPVDQQVLRTLSKKISDTYKGITVASTGNDVTITAADTDYFPQFLAAISTLQRGGRNWKVKISTLCAGRDCPGSKLTASLKVEMIRLGEPEAKKLEENKK